MELTSVFNAEMRVCHSSAGMVVPRKASREESSIGVAEDEEAGPMAMLHCFCIAVGGFVERRSEA